ncbi:MAG: hypothetical protein ACREBF_04095 [Candidatus Micrarchaeales archaeon]
MEAKTAQIPRLKTSHALTTFAHIVSGGEGMRLDIAFKSNDNERLVGFYAVPQQTSMRNGVRQEDMRRKLELINDLLTVCDKTQTPVEIYVYKTGLNDTYLNEACRNAQVDDLSLPNDRLYIDKFHISYPDTEIACHCIYKDNENRKIGYRVGIRAATAIINLDEHIKILRELRKA